MDEWLGFLRALRPDGLSLEALLELARTRRGDGEEPTWLDEAATLLELLPETGQAAVAHQICRIVGRKFCRTEKFDLPEFVPDCTRRFPRRLALEWGVLPVRLRGTELVVASALPLSYDEELLLEAMLDVQVQVQPVIASPRSLHISFERIYGPLGAPAPGTRPFPFALRSPSPTLEGFRRALLTHGAASPEELPEGAGDWEGLAARLLRRPARDPEALATAIARTAGLGLHRPGPEATVDLQACSLLPLRLAEELDVLPLACDHDRFLVAVTHPLSPEARTELALYVGLEPIERIATPRALQAGLVRRYGELEARRRAAARGSTPLAAPAAADEVPRTFQRGRAGGQELVEALRVLRGLPLEACTARTTTTRLALALVLQALHAARETPDPRVWRPILEELLGATLPAEARPLVARCVECAPRELAHLAERILGRLSS